MRYIPITNNAGRTMYFYIVTIALAPTNPTFHTVSTIVPNLRVHNKQVPHLRKSIIISHLLPWIYRCYDKTTKKYSEDRLLIQIRGLVI